MKELKARLNELNKSVLESGLGDLKLTIEGLYRNGIVELLQTVENVKQARVLVTFIENSDLELSSLGIDKAEAAVLRETFAAFEDWNDPEMDIYNDYDIAKAALDKSRQAR